MNTKLQELTDKIYLEGVEKGNTQAKVIISQAEMEATEIITKANAKAAEIIAGAELKSSELSKNTQSELHLFSQQATNALKTEIADLLSDVVVTQAVKTATSDKTFMQNTIFSLVQEWVKTDHLTIEAKDAKALEDFFMLQAKELLDKGVAIEQVNGAKVDFAIISSKGGYKITFGDDQFIAYFKEFLRPKLIEMLF